MTPRYRNENRMKLMGETRQRLIIAAIDEFPSEGFEGASINRITRAAGVAVGTIYNYFSGKNDLMLSLLGEVVFASKYGNTAEIAERIGKVLREAGLQTDVLPANRVESTAYQAVVLGSAVYIWYVAKRSSIILKSK